MVHEAHEDKILNWLVKYPSNLILMHHRYPTSTINTKRTAHPFSTKAHFGDTQYVLVHNGHVVNATSLRKKHEAMGIKYYSKDPKGNYNDSESLLWDFALAKEGEKEFEAYGGIAFVCLKIVSGKLERMYFGRNANKPLKFYRDKHGIAISSEGSGEEIKSDTLYNWNYEAKRLTTTPFVIRQYAAYTPSATPTYGAHNNWGNSYTPNSSQSTESREYYNDMAEYYDTCFDYDELGNWSMGGGFNVDGETEAEVDIRLAEEKVLSARARNVFSDALGGAVGRYASRSLAEKFKSRKSEIAKTEAAGFGIDTSQWTHEDWLKAFSEHTVSKEEQSVLDYEYDGDAKLFLPPNIRDNVTIEDEAEDKVMEALIKCKGLFNKAYEELEFWYVSLFDDQDWAPKGSQEAKDVEHQILVQERAMEMIVQDPSNVDEASISKDWEAIWES